MKKFVQNIESIAIKNEEFRRVLYTMKNCQLLVMTLKLNEENRAEIHRLDRFIRVEQGTGEAVLDCVCTTISSGRHLGRLGKNRIRCNTLDFQG